MRMEEIIFVSLNEDRDERRLIKERVWYTRKLVKNVTWMEMRGDWYEERKSPDKKVKPKGRNERRLIIIEVEK